MPNFDASDACIESGGAEAVKGISALMPDAIDAKLAESMLLVGVNGPEKLWESPEREGMLDYVCNRLTHKGCRVPWRSTYGEIGPPTQTRNV